MLTNGKVASFWNIYIYILARLGPFLFDKRVRAHESYLIVKFTISKALSTTKTWITRVQATRSSIVDSPYQQNSRIPPEIFCFSCFLLLIVTPYLKYLGNSCHLNDSSDNVEFDITKWGNFNYNFPWVFPSIFSNFVIFHFNVFAVTTRFSFVDLFFIIQSDAEWVETATEIYHFAKKKFLNADNAYRCIHEAIVHDHASAYADQKRPHHPIGNSIQLTWTIEYYRPWMTSLFN